MDNPGKLQWINEKFQKNFILDAAVKHSTITIRPVLILLTALSVACLSGCRDGGEGAAGDSPGSLQGAGDSPSFRVVGKLEARRLNEASGIQVGANGVLFLHNDDGTLLFFADSSGRDLGSQPVEDAKSRDWEDITRVPGPDGPLLIIGDIGDNRQVRKRVSLYFVPEPERLNHAAEVRVWHRLRFSYPDGPRDVESMAYDPDSGQILLLSKRDQPPRLYALPLDLALWQRELEAEFMGEVPGFRPPTRKDILRNPGRGLWVSQPTGMDISPDGRMAAVITYRSLYLFRREASESWVEAFGKPPEEFIGPPGSHDEAVSFSLDGRSIFVAAEGQRAPLFRLDLPH